VDFGEAVALLAQCADKFILRHEVSHHILGHTETGGRPLSYIEDLPAHCKYWKKLAPASHQQEYEADASALAMTLQAPCPDIEVKRQREFETAIGALLTLTVIGQLVGDVDDVTPSHPSVSSRFDQCLEILRVICKHNVNNVKGTIFLIKRFQTLLWITQRKGLGRRWEGMEQI